jgi:4-amino-4-deoxy-L-arabinose transferase-like glycosyltransferase
MLQNKSQNTTAFASLLVLCYFAFFWQMEARGLLIFDEARQAVSALEMAQSGNLWVTTFEGKPEMWSTKPPLFIWLTAASLKLFGYSVWALRLPAALAGLILVLTLFKYLLKYTGNLFIAFTSALLLVSSPGFIGEHVARTADYDSLLILLIFLYCTSYFSYIETGYGNKLLYTLLFFCLAVLTKGIAAGFAIPALLIYTLYRKRFFTLIKQWQLYVGIIATIAAVGGYYLIREGYNPSYMQAVYNNELGGRFNNALEGNIGPWYFYFTKLGDWRQFSLGFYLLLPLTIASLFTKGSIRNLAVFSCIMWATILLVVSAAATKLAHYAAPMYPFMVINMAVGLYAIYQKLATKSIWRYAVFIIPVYCLINAVLYVNYFTTLHNINTVEYGHLINKLAKQNAPIKRLKTFTAEYNPGLTFYTEAYNLQGYNITNYRTESITVGDTIISCEPALLKQIDEKYQYSLINQTEQCKAVIIKGYK